MSAHSPLTDAHAHLAAGHGALAGVVINSVEEADWDGTRSGTRMEQLEEVYDAVACHLGISRACLAQRTSANFARLFRGF